MVFLWILNCFFVKSRTGYGRVSASGGNGFAGGSGGRVSVDIFSVRDDPTFLFHGKSICYSNFNLCCQYASLIVISVTSDVLMFIQYLIILA